MDGEALFRLEAVDQVFRELGCSASTNQIAHDQRSWLKKLPDGTHAIAVWTFEDGRMSISESAVLDLAHALKLDGWNVVQRIKVAGGTNLDP